MNLQNPVLCSKVDISYTDRPVHITGWVNSVLKCEDSVFISLRDTSGTIAVTLNPKLCGRRTRAIASGLKLNDYIDVMGIMNCRSVVDKNRKLKAESVKVKAEHLDVIKETANKGR